MKTLPDNPHLDHLRRQAKDLLAGLRDSDPAASLADAQASLAEQYGFRTWAELKAEVDRLQGGAETADPTLAAQIAARFELGAPTGPMRSLSRPDEIGRRWLLETVRGRWAARTVDDVYPVTDGEHNTRFQEAAARADVHLPAPIRSRTGAGVETIGGNRWRVYEWLRTGPPLAAPVSAAITRQVGEILATLHAVRFPADGICPWNARLLGPIEQLPGPVREPASIGDGAPATEPVLCHNNLNPGNVRVGAGGRLVVTGWEHASGLPPEWELAAALASWTINPNGGVNTTGARALIDGYRTRAGILPPLSLNAFRGAAIGLLNYVTGQLQLARTATTLEDRRFADRNTHHLLTHLPTRATYEQVLAAALE
ncbi:phosphotransferase [Actinocrispum sp. NPDC049592]|uniref:phosphotransferase n=1 Tax=Actinocrispum sp. NPDC049592 TaxID=3154835 RepID=UPI00341E6614